MNPSDYRYQIESIYADCLNVNDWLLTDDQFQQFVLMGKKYKGGLVLDNWKIFLSGGGIVDDFYEWWMEYRPDRLEGDSGSGENSEKGEEKKKSPFDAVKKKVRMK